jgi:chorismate synthase
MSGTFAYPKFRNGNGTSRSSNREKALSVRAAEQANNNLEETLVNVRGSLDGLVDLDANERLAKDGPNEVAHENRRTGLTANVPSTKTIAQVAATTVAINAMISRQSISSLRAA